MQSQKHPAKNKNLVLIVSLLVFVLIITVQTLVVNNRWRYFWNRKIPNIMNNLPEEFSKPITAVSDEDQETTTKTIHSSSPLAYANDNQVLYDARNNKDEHIKLSNIDDGKILNIVKKSIIELASQEKLKLTPEDQEYSLIEKREAGEFEPSILDSTTGSFTASYTKETVYLIFVGEEGAGHADNMGTRRLAVFADDTLVANPGTPIGFYDIAKICDLNSDGINELLLVGGFTNSGYNEGWVSLVDIIQGKWREIKDFGIVCEDNSGCVFDGSYYFKASVIFYPLPPKGEFPKFYLDRYEAKYAEDIYKESERNFPKFKDYKYLSTEEISP